MKWHGNMVINRNHPYHLLADRMVKVTGRLSGSRLNSEPTWAKELTYEPLA